MTPPAAEDSPWPLVMAVETSCDETAVAIFAQKTKLLSSVVASQVALHRAHGGVVPEVASRNHLTQLWPQIEIALAEAGVAIENIDAFAATVGPGLATSLMLGAAVAKALAVALGKKYVAINHLEGHLLSPFFGGDIVPSLGLIVSGGHTILVDVAGFGSYRIIGQTRDDAAGEAFDKVGKMLGLPYPGGPEIDRIAVGGNAKRFAFPRSMLKETDFSFSGLKTAVRYMLPRFTPQDLPDICASFQEAVVETLVSKTISTAKRLGRNAIAVSGGVSCNSRLRAKFHECCGEQGLDLFLAPSALCTDNAAMIAFVAAEKISRGHFSPLAADIDPNLTLAPRADSLE
ncbi:MAG: tRNA (adenosine(37)-N6)-threonylcarbamoyltransferase complex transferase subunit TsaD [Verrucomicrobiota bacterium]|nr:tRNA (adenosine(37)-N6)-threonylcarbamoyltransferase complex transferase subunit TsaD [Verrucomicrobiota bacterium]